MVDSKDFNSKYHLSSNKELGWFSNFEIFKFKSRTPSYYRTPYPIIIFNPSMSRVIQNFNKSDFLSFFLIYSCSFLYSIKFALNTKSYKHKLEANKVIMRVAILSGLIFITLCSSDRLEGKLDNGLRWKNEDVDRSLYYFNEDYTRRPIMKHLISV